MSPYLRFTTASVFLVLALLGGGCASSGDPQATSNAKGSGGSGGNVPATDSVYAQGFGEAPTEGQPMNGGHYDPIEPVNRVIFSVNDGLYTYVFMPTAKGYAWIMPDPVEIGIDNFFTNLAYPIRFVNSLLQGKFDRAGEETGHFLLNTTVGVAGVFPAGQQILGDPPSSEDLGQTLGVWGIHNGPYLVLPVIGSTTLRDAVGRGGDNFLSPLTYLPEWEYEAAASATDFINSLPDRMERYRSIKEGSLDPYVAFRDAYIKYRHRQVER